MRFSDLQDSVELNRLLAADPALRDNMKEMGYIKAVPFMRDHNEQHETQYAMTEYGLKEMRERFANAAIFKFTGEVANDHG